MAGIIARMARANWERKKGRLGSRNLTSDKSNKVLPPFGERFVPDLHNTYLRREQLEEVQDYNVVERSLPHMIILVTTKGIYPSYTKLPCCCTFLSTDH